MDKETVKMTKEDLTQMLTSIAETALEAKAKDLGFEKGATKVAMPFSGKSREEIASLDSKSKAVEFIKAVYAKDLNTLASFKALNETSNPAGGFLVPEEWAAEVNRIVEDFGLIAKLGRRYPMKSDTLRVPRLASSVSVSYPGEGVAGTPSQPVFEQVVLSAKTLVGLTAMTNELLEDANVDVVNLLTELFAEAIAGETDAQGLVGNGAPFTGILNDTDVNEVDAESGETSFEDAATPDNFRNMISAVKPWALQGAAFIMHRTVWAAAQKKKASTGGDYFASAVNPVLTGATADQGFPTAQAGTMWGYPVYLSDKMPALTDTAVDTRFAIFGNLKHLYVGARKDMAVSISQDATVGSDNLFEQNMSAVRVVARHALAVGLPSAFAVLKSAAS
jgi:HK97 family phage major capsid protein